MAIAYAWLRSRAAPGGLTLRKISNDIKRYGFGSIDEQKIYLRNRRRGFLIGQGPRVGINRMPAGKPRLQCQPAEVRPLFERRSRNHESVPTRRGLRHR